MTRRFLSAALLVAATLLAAVPPAAAYMPNPQPPRGDSRPPSVRGPVRPFTPFVFPATRNRAAVKGRFFVGYDPHGRRVCWVVWADGTEGLVLDVC